MEETMECSDEKSESERSWRARFFFKTAVKYQLFDGYEKAFRQMPVYVCLVAPLPFTSHALP